ncbi:MAG: MvdC/MvdD family ATP grasp protein [Frankia sp.]
MTRTVLIVARRDDVQAQHLDGLIAGRRARTVLVDPADFPAEVGLSVDVDEAGRLRRTLRARGDRVELGSFVGAWLRSRSLPVPDPLLVDPTVREYVRLECAAFLDDVWAGLDCPVVPAPPPLGPVGPGKITQLAAAGRVGFEVPETLVTTDPDEFLDFRARHDGRVVTKVIEQVGFRLHTRDFFRYTEPVPTRSLGYSDAIRLCPVIVQPLVAKALEVRVTVVGDRVFAAELDSQVNRRTTDDWRRGRDIRAVPHRTHALPAREADACVRLTRQLGLTFSAIDLIVTPDGRYVFLEANADGEFRWIEILTGLPITEALCDLLLAGADAPLAAVHPATGLADAATRTSGA